MNKQPIEIPRFIYYNIDIFANTKPCEYLISWANILIVEIEAFKILSDNAEKNRRFGKNSYIADTECKIKKISNRRSELLYSYFNFFGCLVVAGISLIG